MTGELVTRTFATIKRGQVFSSAYLLQGEYPGNALKIRMNIQDAPDLFVDQIVDGVSLVKSNFQQKIARRV